MLSSVWRRSAPTINSSSDSFAPIRKWHSRRPIEHLRKRRTIIQSIWSGITGWIPGSGSSSFSFNFGNAGRSASGYRRNTLYIIRTDFMRKYGFVELIWNHIWAIRRSVSGESRVLILTSVMMSFAKSLDKSADMKQLSPLSATPASYWFWEFKSFRIIFVANIRSWNHKRITKFDLLSRSYQWHDKIYAQSLASLSAWKHWQAAR